MTIEKICPCCNKKTTVNTPHEFEKRGSQQRLKFSYTSQGTNIDNPKLDALFPVDDDGQELVVVATRQTAEIVEVEVFRRPRVAQTSASASGVSLSPMTPAVVAAVRTREDMLTEAAEIGLTVKEGWNNLQLAQAIEKKKATAARPD